MKNEVSNLEDDFSSLLTLGPVQCQYWPHAVRSRCRCRVTLINNNM